MPFYYFYFARCADGSLYTGCCDNLEAREKKHNKGTGALHKKHRRPVKIVYHEAYFTLVDARRREAQVKRWSRIKKERLAHGKHPTKASKSSG